MDVSAETPKLKNILEKTTQFFREKDFDSPRLDAELLLAKALNLRRIDLYLKYDQPLAAAELAICRDFVRRRGKGEPVAYILGSKDFYGLSFEVDKNVLIPRPETELLVEAVLNEVKARGAEERAFSILDLGCGSGCIGLALAHHLKNARVDFVDISTSAIAVARKNAANHGTALRSQFLCADAGTLAFENKTFDIVVANPPYISASDSRVDKDVLEFEPHTALFSEDNGLGANFSWSKNILRYLSPGAIMAFEFGIDQSKQVSEHFEKLEVFQNVSIIKDLSNIDRHVFAIRKDS